ncbi:MULTISPECIES: hypothetical protein [Vibrio]|uniref:Lipoprotein n=1 Tax=Vibrio halioticoli NBRC 102217 TaxID=1219072 RepID=V5FB81_9VIBR|nr:MULTISPECIES: hypothetical protein [Vibrio]MPW37174.1 hypothetical protein [Vibrio sp. B1Z05]GAD88488.1 hypothetical protein VHA01S_005_00910 [Vibrio halioticoli NBRC 102217]
MIKKYFIVLLVALLAGCTHNQAKALAINTSSVNVYPQNMTNIQLCDTLFYGRHTNQTLAAIGSEFNRRKLSKTWCDQAGNKWYLTSTVEWIVHPHSKAHHSKTHNS